MTLETPRLLLRPWRDEDLAPFAALNRDPEVMRFFEEPLSPERSEAWAGSIAAAIEEQGWGLWALERRDTGAFIGFTGLQVPRHVLPFNPCVEVGWRLARSAWGHGFATESIMSFRWRESIVATISGGTSQIQRNAICRSMGLRTY